MNKEILMAFLNAFLEPMVPRIVDIEYRPTEQLGATDQEKRIIDDIVCTDKTGRRFIVEMQRARQGFFLDRIFVYASAAIAGQAKRGDRVYRVDPVYCFCILDFEPEVLKGSDQFFHFFQFTDPESGITLPQEALCFLVLTRFSKKLQGPEEWERLSEREKWAYALKHSTEFGDPEFSHVTGIFAELKKICRLSKLNDMEILEYKKSVLDYEDVKDAVRCSYEDGEKDGVKKGMEKGRETGREEGREEGILAVAKNLKFVGVPAATIAEATGLSMKQVEAL
ncbi:MAG: Rpn family recombination-promoting nuclease/putative transposase [Bacteroidales bacterium]|nr:Rpn family recombination-promoting nuclease/putative transposase [Bacteroidales bacterium]